MLGSSARARATPRLGDVTGQVDFYLLETAGADGVARTACRLAEKAWRLGHRVFVHTESVEHARRLDALLWTFRQDSFVPHAIAHGSATGGEPIVIGDGREPDGTVDVLINLTDHVPLCAEHSGRVAEIVAADNEARAAGRARYRRYLDAGHPIKTHRLRAPT